MRCEVSSLSTFVSCLAPGCQIVSIDRVLISRAPELASPPDLLSCKRQFTNVQTIISQSQTRKIFLGMLVFLFIFCLKLARKYDEPETHTALKLKFMNFNDNRRQPICII